MNPFFTKMLAERFAGQFEIVSAAEKPTIRFPAKSLDFGDVLIVEEDPGVYVLYIGRFTRDHFDAHVAHTDDDRAKEIAEKVIQFLDALFADQIICYKSGEKRGGYYAKSYGKGIEEVDLYVWSGLYKKRELGGGETTAKL